ANGQHWSRRSRGAGKTNGRQGATFLEGQEEGQDAAGEAGGQAAEAIGAPSRRRGPESRRRDLAAPGFLTGNKRDKLFASVPEKDNDARPRAHMPAHRAVGPAAVPSR